MISIVQNFICTQPKRLEVIQKEVPNMAKIFGDYEFFINYNTTQYFNEVYNTYQSNIPKLNFYNNLDKNWGAITLALLQKITTPYVLILCEDFEYRIKSNEWKDIMDEVISKDIKYMPLGRLWKYTKKEYWSGYDKGKNLWLYPASKSPGSSLSVDALYKTELLIEKLKELLLHNPKRFPLHLPHHYEDIFHEPNGVRKWGDKILCAVPKKIIWMHIQEETETNLNK